MVCAALIMHLHVPDFCQKMAQKARFCDSKGYKALGCKQGFSPISATEKRLAIPSAFNFMAPWECLCTACTACGVHTMKPS